FDFTPTRWLNVHVSGGGWNDRAGLVEAYANVRRELGLDHVQVRAGQFFLPTSRENKDELWASPYTISFSALNSWIAEEVRPIGVDLEYRHTTSRGHAITTGATAFRGNDTMGTLLAWRGWAMHDRIATLGEVLPLPPLASLDTFFAKQKDGTRPFGNDLDGRTGYAARVRWSVPERANVQYTFVDNRGDRELYVDQYAWATRFHQLGAELGDPGATIAAAEYMTGTTGMGDRLAGFVDADFYAAYVLVSHKRNRNRFSARYEIFKTDEQDFSPAEANEENGRAWTFTWMFDVTEHTRLAAEFTQVTGDRPGTPDFDGRGFTLEARYRF
ncbi:MAG TPA: hypothetical protein VHK90_10545, partial [Thermoanaerobaculia bacterium]|nr:hypothetical protein [Thermoanaerobaculia bacterium]